MTGHSANSALTISFCFTELGYMVDSTCRFVTVAHMRGWRDGWYLQQKNALGGYFRFASDLLDADGSCDEEKKSWGDEQHYLERGHAQGHAAAVRAWPNAVSAKNAQRAFWSVGWAEKSLGLRPCYYPTARQ
jgi:hypothetical protein